MLDELHGSQVFSKIDLKSIYHQIQIKRGDKWKRPSRQKEGYLNSWLCHLSYQMPQYFHEVDESSIQTFYWEVCRHLFQ